MIISKIASHHWTSTTIYGKSLFTLNCKIHWLKDLLQIMQAALVVLYSSLINILYTYGSWSVLFCPALHLFVLSTIRIWSQICWFVSCVIIVDVSKNIERIELVKHIVFQRRFNNDKKEKLNVNINKWYWKQPYYNWKLN